MQFEQDWRNAGPNVPDVFLAQGLVPLRLSSSFADSTAGGRRPLQRRLCRGRAILAERRRCVL